jgi:hypothetical protein
LASTRLGKFKLVRLEQAQPSKELRFEISVGRANRRSQTGKAYTNVNMDRKGSGRQIRAQIRRRSGPPSYSAFSRGIWGSNENH